MHWLPIAAHWVFGMTIISVAIMRTLVLRSQTAVIRAVLAQGHITTAAGGPLPSTNISTFVLFYWITLLGSFFLCFTDDVAERD